jgi:filamin
VLKLQKVENITFSLRYLANVRKINIVNISAEDVHDQKTKLVLGLVWIIILHFHFRSGTMVKRDLLDWCNRVLQPQGESVGNFTSDWTSGVAFQALVNYCHGSTVFPLSQVDRKTDAGKIKAMNDAFVAAERELKFPQLLDADDMIDSADELSVMTYIGYFRAYKEAPAPITPAAPVARAVVAVEPVLDASLCSASGDGLRRATAGQAARFAVQTNVKKGGAKVTTKLGDGSAMTSISDKSDGTYDVSYVPRVAGEHDLVVCVGGQEVPQSPFRVVVAPGASSAAHAEASGSGLHRATAGDSTKFQIQTFDAYGNKCTTGGGDNAFVVKLVGEKEFEADVTSNGDGTYRVAYKVDEPCEFTIHVTTGSDDEHIRDSPFKCVVTESAAAVVAAAAESARAVVVEPAVDASLCSASGDGLRSATAGQAARFIVQTNVTAGGAEVTAKLGKGSAMTSISDKSDGTYDVSYVPRVAGEHDLVVCVGGQEVPQSPFRVVVAPGASSAAHAEASGSGLRRATVDEATTFQIQTFDAYGNKCATGSGEDAFAAMLIGGTDNNVFDADVTDNGDGTYTVAYEVDEPGEFTIHVTGDDEHIRDSPFKCVVTERAAAVATRAAAPTSAAPPAPVASAPVRRRPFAAHCTAGGAGRRGSTAGEPATFRVATFDRDGVPLDFGGATIAGSLNGEPLSVADDGNGTYKCAYVETRAGQFALAVTVDGSAIKGSPFQVTIAPSAPSAAHAVVTGDGARQAFTDEPALIEIQTRDQYGNACVTGGAQITVQVMGGENNDLVDGVVTDNGDGTYDAVYVVPAEFAVLEPDMCMCAVAMGGTVVDESPFEVTVNVSERTRAARAKPQRKKSVAEIEEEQKSVRGNDDIHDAALAGDERACRAILVAAGKEARRVVRSKNDDQRSPIYAAAWHGSPDAVSTLIEFGALVDDTSAAGWTPLAVAAHRGNLGAVKRLVAARANVEIQDKDGSTPLFHAACRGHTDVCRYLIEEAGADVNGGIDGGWKPLHGAVYHTRGDVTLYLLSVPNVDVNVRNVMYLKSYNALHLALSRKRWFERAFTALLRHHAVQVSAASKNGQTALHICALWGHVDAARALVRRGADPAALNKRKQTPLAIAVAEQRAEVAQYLASVTGTPLPSALGGARTRITPGTDHDQPEMADCPTPRKTK